MRQDNLFKRGGRDSRVTSLFHLFSITFLLVVLLITIVITSSCDGFFNEQEREENKGSLNLSFAKEEGISALKGINLLKSDAEIPDTNFFILTVKSAEGTLIYSGYYSQRPQKFNLEAGSYNIEVVSHLFDSPSFDSPCYFDSATVVVESGKVTNLSFLCRMSNGAVKLGFTQPFKERFKNYTPLLEDSNGWKLYPFSEQRYLYLAAGDIYIKMKSSSDSFLIARKNLRPTEMLSVNLHSSTSDDDNPVDNSGLYTGIVIDTSSIWSAEELVIGERRDGSSKELALSVEEIPFFAGHKGVWVRGYIVGYLTTGSLKKDPPFSTDSNIAIASLPNESDRESCAGITLPQGAVRSELNLKDNPSNLGREVWLKGTITESYFGLPGLSTVTEYSW